MYKQLIPALAFGIVSVSARSTCSPPRDTPPSNTTSSKLFPAGQGDSSWSVAKEVSGALPFSDDTFRPVKNIKALSHDSVTAPDGVLSMKAHYPAGSYNPSGSPRGGFSFYAPGPEDVDLTAAKEATLTYSVYFPDGFEFVQGGKLPGLFGGNSDDESYTCSGGRETDVCFSARFMWRKDGAGELYTYLPAGVAANEKVCNVPPHSYCNPSYGQSVGRGAFAFKAGARSTISERVRLNDEGKENGELEVYVDGKSVFAVTGLVLRTSGAGRIRGLQMQTFFGGSDKTWATPKDVDAYFGDFSVAIIERL